MRCEGKGKAEAVRKKEDESSGVFFFNCPIFSDLPTKRKKERENSRGQKVGIIFSRYLSRKVLGSKVEFIPFWPLTRQLICLFLE